MFVTPRDRIDEVFLLGLDSTHLPTGKNFVMTGLDCAVTAVPALMFIHLISYVNCSRFERAALKREGSNNDLPPCDIHGTGNFFSFTTSLVQSEDMHQPVSAKVRSGVWAGFKKECEFQSELRLA